MKSFPRLHFNSDIFDKENFKSRLFSDKIIPPYLSPQFRDKFGHQDTGATGRRSSTQKQLHVPRDIGEGAP